MLLHDGSLRARGGAAALFVCVALLGGACAKRASHPVNPSDPFSRVAGAELDAPCSSVAEAGPIPAMKGAASAEDATDDDRDDVVAYLAHPYDEGFFTGGTLLLLGEKKRKTAVVLLSHGEGGRLLQVNERGEFVERYDVPKAKLVAQRAEESGAAATLMRASLSHLYPADANVDFGKTEECEETLETWERTVSGGVADVLRRLVADIRQRRPRVILTHDARNDTHWMDHGHNKATGALVDAAARMAADPRVGQGAPHVVEELYAIAPSKARHDVSLPVGAERRRRVLALYPSQFRIDKASEAASRETEDYVLVWRAKGASVPAAGSILEELTSK